jgi:hypothetical protein
MKKLPKITVHHHRNMPSFRWFVNGKAHYRIIKDVKNIEMERTQLGMELLNGISKKTAGQQQKAAEQQQKTLVDHIEDFYQDLLTVAAPK